nr:hypothetical protein [Myxococcales bacterium]
LSEAWRHELAPFGVRVVVLQPGAYRTDIFGRNRRVAANAHDEASPYAAWARSLDELATERVQQVARDPQEVADRICAVLEASDPRFRHPMGVGAMSRTLLKRLAPFGLLQRAIARITSAPSGSPGCTHTKNQVPAK